MFLQVNSLHLGSKFNYYKYCMTEGSIFEKCKQEDDKGQIAFRHILFRFSIFHLGYKPSIHKLGALSNRVLNQYL